MGYDSRAAYYRQRFLEGERVLTRDELDRRIEDTAARLNGILDTLKAGPLGDRILVFGSVARGRFLPGDVDAVVDLRSGPPVEGGDLKALLDLAYANYGWFDPFVIEPCGRLRVRGARAISWVDAENANVMLAAIESEGRPLRDVSVVPDQSPAPYEPESWLDPAARRVEELRKGWHGMTKGGWCRRESIPKYQREYLSVVANHELPEVRALFEEFAAETPEHLWRDLVPDAPPAPGP